MSISRDQEHLDTERDMQTSRDERENDEEAEHVTQVDVDLAEQDLRDREDDFTAAYNAMH
jgi:hypothetical protein